MRKSTHTAEYAALCQELRRVRESAGLSQRDMAARLQVPHSWVAKVETGERRIDLLEFHWFVGACGSDPTAACARLTAQWSAPPGRGSRKGGRAK